MAKSFRLKFRKPRRASAELFIPEPGKPATITGAWERVTDEQRAAARWHVETFYHQLHTGRLVPTDHRRRIQQMRDLM